MVYSSLSASSPPQATLSPDSRLFVETVLAGRAKPYSGVGAGSVVRVPSPSPSHSHSPVRSVDQRHTPRSPHSPIFLPADRKQPRPSPRPEPVARRLSPSPASRPSPPAKGRRGKGGKVTSKEAKQMLDEAFWAALYRIDHAVKSLRLTGSISRADAVRVRKWVDKLSAPLFNVAWLRNRNLHAAVLASILSSHSTCPASRNGRLWVAPFDKLPYDGPLRALPRHMRMYVV
ncbi:uncharacterized protein AMSG_06607 [Thecamonas trahens ATCC 50062]|uniref:DUF4485 domain-containing protein n=1 Tax=Thecamonas trahens ATCC 50062 TaxID=461836 RepID=A0A0L0DHD2_THETB|nr:hypothetical protein AMSG_06607 [Thecamonas trahens ATCC 50062]KNC50718.1 hypothetical protein AMSG_06607 [Thecamonas trahens ATCC 50062]|eukprot:XP_013756687.1 hypothetical protein AMSG_06607 [Thecamonas trahens ATCC 50062]